MRSPCCDDKNQKKGPWTAEEDQKLIDYINRNGRNVNWKSIPKQAGLSRCGKSCRLRWTNYLRPDIKRGHLTEEEERTIIKLHSVLGNKWSRIASHLPGRTDNEIKNLWNTQIRKKLLHMGIDPNTHKPRTDLNHLLNLSQLLSSTVQFSNPMSISPLESNDQLAQIQLLQNLLQLMNPSTTILSSGPQNPILLNLIASSISTPHEGLLNIPLSVTPQAVPNESQFDIGEYFEGGFGPNDIGSNSKSLGSTSFGVKAENTIPALVEASPVENKSSSTPTSQLSAAVSPIDNDFFDGWEKFLDDVDGTCDSYWREIQDGLASSSQSPLLC